MHGESDEREGKKRTYLMMIHQWLSQPGGKQPCALRCPALIKKAKQCSVASRGRLPLNLEIVLLHLIQRLLTLFPCALRFSAFSALASSLMYCVRSWVRNL